MTTLVPTLSTRYFPRTVSWQRDLFLIIGSALFVATLAQVKIPLPFTPVSFTGQTFAVLLVGAAALVLYTAMGAFGLPLFAGGASGLVYISGPTLGYLIGFIGAAYVVDLLTKRGLERSVRTSLIPFLVGTLIIHIFGASWLAVLFGIEKAFALGVLPFLIGDVIKMLLAALALPAAWKLIK